MLYGYVSTTQGKGRADRRRAAVREKAELPTLKRRVPAERRHRCSHEREASLRTLATFTSGDFPNTNLNLVRCRT